MSLMADNSSGRIRTEFDGQVASITLDHPPVNIIDFEMISEIVSFLDEVRDEPRLCAVAFQGAGRLFSAGVDVASHLPETVDAMIREFHRVFETLDAVGAPTLALVHGACLGGACELVGYLDTVIATESATFGLPEIKLGVFPPVAAALFPQRFGHQRAMQMLLTGNPIDAHAALEAGLVSRVVPAAQAPEALESAISPLRERSASSLRAVKRASIDARRATFRQVVAPSERVYLEQLMATSDAVEGLRAFLEKRDPVWSHN